MIAIVDYGVGNLFSIKCSFAAIGVDAIITQDPEDIRKADKILLPGVGAFEDASVKIRELGMADVIISEVNKGKPILGICLGMQLLFEKSYEYGEYFGLGLLKGTIRSLSDIIKPGYKIPHIGWNALIFKKDNPLFTYIKDGDCVYFVHSYFAAECEDSLIAECEYSVPVTAAVSKGNIYGCQFHPEKSGMVGLNILKAFCEVV